MTKLDRWIDQQNAMETPKRVDPTLFAPAEHVHPYLPIGGTAVDSARLGNQLPSYYAKASDIPAEPTWQSWTPTLTGWSMINLTRACRFMREGNAVYFNVYVYGTSNSTGASISLPPGLPAVNITNLYWRGISAGIDNGVALTSPIMWQISPGGTEIFCYSNLSAGGWTASGGKLVAFQGFYETSAT